MACLVTRVVSAPASIPPIDERDMAMVDATSKNETGKGSHSHLADYLEGHTKDIEKSGHGGTPDEDSHLADALEGHTDDINKSAHGSTSDNDDDDEDYDHYADALEGHTDDINKSASGGTPDNDGDDDDGHLADALEGSTEDGGKSASGSTIDTRDPFTAVTDTDKAAAAGAIANAMADTTAQGIPEERASSQSNTGKSPFDVSEPNVPIPVRSTRGDQGLADKIERSDSSSGDGFDGLISVDDLPISVDI